MRRRIAILFLIASFAQLLFSFSGGVALATEPATFRVMTWNIWDGGRHDDEELGPKRVADVIRESNADLVAMQETYGSGKVIAESLGFHFQPRGTNVSILSRYPIIEDISVFEEFKCVGAIVELPGGKRVALYSIWLPYDAEIWKVGTRNLNDIPSMIAACKSSQADLAAILEAIDQRLADKQYADIPVLLAGDFNSMSHLDYREIARDQYGAVVDWGTSQVAVEAGFRDSYRETNYVIDRKADRTWSPRFPDQEQDRIDFIYYRADSLTANASEVIAAHSAPFPSDHAAVVTTFTSIEPPAADTASSFSVVSYNIRHGRGNDNRVDLDRVADVLKTFAPDFVGLQEVDFRATRSGQTNQASELARRLNMHASFGSFMDFQGGWYGMGFLSKHPIRHTHSIRLAEGNEPRVALATEVCLPSGQSLMIVNVHFDWVRNDQFRFAQASELAKYLSELTVPYLLLGDFNDQPGSRTLDLFHSIASEAAKPADDRFTFSSTDPRIEIDFIFGAPKSRWRFRDTSVVDESVVSDHRPVVTVAELSFVD